MAMLPFQLPDFSEPFAGEFGAWPEFSAFRQEPFARAPGSWPTAPGRTLRTEPGNTASIPDSGGIEAALSRIHGRVFAAALARPDPKRVDELLPEVERRNRLPWVAPEFQAARAELLRRSAERGSATEAADAATASLRRVAAASHPAGLGPESGDEEIIEAGKHLANAFLNATWQAAQRDYSPEMLEALIKTSSPDLPEGVGRLYWPDFCEQIAGIDPENLEYPGFERARCHRWWRRTLRRIVRRGRGTLDLLIAEAEAKRNWKYASRRAVKERREQIERNQKTLETLIAVSSAGDMVPLNQLAAGAPERQRAELLARVYGLGQLAQEQGLEPFIVTLTCPSRMHPSSDRWDGTNPREAHQWLTQQWARWRAFCRRETPERSPLRCYGLRVEEPHQDGCPHLHLVTWTDDGGRLADSLDTYFRAVADGDEAGAAAHRVQVEPVRHGHGGAIQYAMKYVLKHCSPQGLDGKETADAVDTWRGTWSIRAFSLFATHQQLPTITPWRELRRVHVIDAASPYQPAHAAAHGADYAGYCRAWNDICERTGEGIAPLRGAPRQSRYGDTAQGRIIGLRHAASPDLPTLTTRKKTWEIKRASECRPVPAEPVTVISIEPRGDGGGAVPSCPSSPRGAAVIPFRRHAGTARANPQAP